MRLLLCVTFAVLPVVAAGLLGAIAVRPNLAWYIALVKPGYTPPVSLFAPVWALLHLLMAVAAWRVLQKPVQPNRQAALLCFFIVLALTAAWPWLFFAAGDLAIALIGIVVQAAAIAVAIVLFARVDVIAALCLVPLAIWAGFATLLNAAIRQLN
jgi:translocator protein